MTRVWFEKVSRSGDREEDDTRRLKCFPLYGNFRLLFHQKNAGVMNSTIANVNLLAIYLLRAKSELKISNKEVGSINFRQRTWGEKSESIILLALLVIKWPARLFLHWWRNLFQNVVQHVLHLLALCIIHSINKIISGIFISSCLLLVY